MISIAGIDGLALLRDSWGTIKLPRDSSISEELRVLEDYLICQREREAAFNIS